MYRRNRKIAQRYKIFTTNNYNVKPTNTFLIKTLVFHINCCSQVNPSDLKFCC